MKWRYWGSGKRLSASLRNKKFINIVKGTQELEFKFRKIPTIRLEITEMTVKEL